MDKIDTGRAIYLLSEWRRRKADTEAAHLLLFAEGIPVGLRDALKDVHDLLVKREQTIHEELLDRLTQEEATNGQN